MKASDIEVAGQRLYGKFGWKQQLAADLGVTRKTVWAWLNGANIPRTVELAIERLVELKS